jgi:hypothetical protein
LNPGTGRPFSASLSKSAAWGVTQGSSLLKQQVVATTNEEIETLKNTKVGDGVNR